MTHWVLLTLILILSTWEIFKIYSSRARLEIDFFLHEAPISLLSAYVLTAYPGGYIGAISIALAYRILLSVAFWKAEHFFKWIAWLTLAFYFGLHFIITVKEMSLEF
jgi:hypothetical protein